jgi:hypothetical protein
LRVNGQCFATGEGATIKGAHQAAARAALDIFDTEIEKLKESHPSDGNAEIVKLKESYAPDRNAEIVKLKETQAPDGNTGNETPAVEPAPVENETRVPITDTIF